MKKAILLLAIMPWAATAAGQGNKTQMAQVTVTNNWTADKANEPVTVRLADIKRLGFDVKGARVALKGKEVPCQLDDTDGDLRNDEVFFLTDIKAGETLTFDVELLAKETDKGIEPRIYTALQIRDKQDKHPDVLKVEASGSSNLFNDIYMHGVTIESELTGYRIYFDHRQNIDLYGKTHRRIELPETQFYTSAEQLAEGYGVDVLWAGNAIGCGSFKDWKDGKPENWTDVRVRGQRVVTTGALRTVVEVYDLGIKNDDGTLYNMYQRYSLYAGHRDLTVDVTFDRASDKTFCTGVQKVGVTAADSVRRGHIPEGILRSDGIAASWGCDYPDMGKKQQWAPEPVGLAVYVPKDYVNETKEDDLNYLYLLKADKNAAIHYYISFCAAREAEGYHTAQEWFTSLDDWKDGLDHPVIVKVK